MRKTLVAIGIAVFSCASAYALDTPDELGKAPQAATGENRAQALKKLGDRYAGVEDYKNAGSFYISALNEARNSFTIEERKRMATVISWGGAFDEAAGEFESILSERPDDLEARLSHARVLSWMGHTVEALSEAESVLRKAPSDRDALLLKADILRWMGEGERARDIYGKLLEGRDNFGARAGLVYYNLSEGDVKGANEDLKLLRPEDAYEEKQLKEITEAVDGASRPSLDASFNYYNDSDFNQSRSYNLHYGFLFENLRANLNYLHTDAEDRIRNNSADNLSAKAETNIAGGVRGGAGAGVTFLSNLDHSVFPSWFLKVDARASGADVTAALSRETITDTAALIGNGVRYTSLSLAATRNFEKLTMRSWYSYRSYSDDNSAHDFQIAIAYPLYQKDVKLKAGDKLRFLNYGRQSLGGYYDPDYHISDQVYLNFSWEGGGLYLMAEPYGGYQTSRRFGNVDSGLFGGCSASLGYKLSKGLRIEADAEGGNSAIGTVSGFKYYQAGIKINLVP
ncbi:MAG: tetratricopeptide repeat protein [Deltaproteobacteria bacterium]|nr:tetratricopeptide repeat protein [Deltaproteobacteria bacterium]